MRSQRVAVGAALWVLAAQFFAAQAVVASAWATPFSLTARHISDLGNTACGAGAESGAAICSPWHAVMNASFMLIGVTMAVGAIAARPAFHRGWPRSVAIVLYVLAGCGVFLVGLFPENEYVAGHTAGAGINFVSGNLALILFGLAMPRASRALARFSVAAGVVGLVAVVLFVADRDLGFGGGGMERVAAYPMAVWQIVAGLWLWTRGSQPGS